MSGRTATLWSTTYPDRPSVSRPLDGDQTVDVAIVGAGYTGLWTALSLLEADPRLRVIVVERHHVGFGASGRNGGWCSALLPVSLTSLARRHGSTATIAWQRAMVDTVDHVGEFAARSAASGLDTQFHKGGTITVARNPAQYQRLEAAVAEARRFGFGEDDIRLLDQRHTQERIRAASTRAALFTPHCAAVHPLRLTDAIAAAATRAGAHIAEGTDVVEVAPTEADDDGRHGPRRCRRPSDRGVHEPGARATSRPPADLLDDDRLGATA